jgi:hypothetical protein
MSRKMEMEAKGLVPKRLIRAGTVAPRFEYTGSGNAITLERMDCYIEVLFVKPLASCVITLRWRLMFLVYSLMSLQGGLVGANVTGKKGW